MDDIETIKRIEHAEDPRLTWAMRIVIDTRVHIVAFLTCDAGVAMPLTCYAECGSVKGTTPQSISNVPLAIAMARTEAIRFMNEKIDDHNASRCQALADATWVIRQASAA